MSNPSHQPFTATDTWYEDADKYWKTVPSSVDGMLGGLEVVHAPDIRDSTKFIEKLRTKHGLKTQYACDCGAGIGRVTKHFLLPQFEKVDMVEQNGQFLEAASSTYLREEKQNGRIGHMFSLGLQDFGPAKGRYDVIWCQWVLSHLTDSDLVKFLQNSADSLKHNGMVCVKENVASRGYVVDSEDSSVTRSAEVFESLFKKAGLKIIEVQTQTDFPDGLFKVKMWALQSIEFN
ncbi:hypothetical protein LPJ78_004755 [Coemansia sp. RSA 989]|nr:hypothetical protein LPJ68_004352 [Coemansia sp. RSA 1086]KAJ1748225.1 hypothetical protein LPJ79_004683 [Coemansia sp. RSA 1821]KAJ1862367.1 hypothetical protein LPJ78_004755 [Coemansia sp. RSA 989]KAJ1870210.1 hypothetical protein LPJ55_004839 [Coemansia sp. RSA 990]KAJ2668999.1 hypothetical protein IWW42_004839 [Coemansia sp. RSA 1085]